MKKIEYFIKLHIRELPNLKQKVKGYFAFEMYGLYFGVAKAFNTWRVTELNTGAYIRFNNFKTRKEAIKKTKEFLKHKGKSVTLKRREKLMKRWDSVGNEGLIEKLEKE